MFNLPWYIWFNVLAIPSVWLLIWVGLKIEKAPRWKHHICLVGTLSQIAILFLHWNPSVASVLNPATYLLAALAIGAALYTIVPMLYESVNTTYRTLQLLGNSDSRALALDSGSSAQTKPVNEVKYVDGVLDIDDDEVCGAEAMQMADALTAALSPNKSFLDSDLVQSNAREFSDSELEEDPRILNGSLWLMTIGLMVVLAAPSFASLNFLKSVLN